jgi:hypothetical protein
MPQKHHLVVIGAVLATVVIAASAFGAAAAPAHARHPSALRFYGFGSRYLPPFQLATPSTMVWKNSGEVFQTFSKGVDGANVNSAARNGATYLAPGSYRLNVNAIGTWTIRIVPGVERPKSLGNGRVGFTGSGGRDLPPFATRAAVRLHWTNTGSIFQILNDSYSGGGTVNSRAHGGDTNLDAGPHLLSVNAIGTWVVSWPAPG